MQSVLAEAAAEERAVVQPQTRWIVGVFVVVPLLAFLFAIWMTWQRGCSWLDLGLLAGMYSLSLLGAGLGFHRLFTHRSFQTVRPVQIAFAVLGSMAAQGSVLRWCAVHRRHHECSDQQGDPHSPYGHGDGLWGTLRGIWHSHTGWLFKIDEPGLDRYVPDLSANRTLCTIDRLFPLWMTIGMLIPAAIGAVVGGTWQAALSAFLWGGPVRIFLLHHVSWSVNSVCHLWGSRPFQTTDQSRNNPIVALFSFGEGWHNNHHAFPASARHGLRWYQVDIAYACVWILKRLGLAWNVRQPAAAALARKARTTAPERLADRGIHVGTPPVVGQPTA